MAENDWDLETDLVVVGGGGCGLLAAFAAGRRGIEVIVLEKDTRLGSNTALSSGSIQAAGTRYQRAAGIEDIPEQLAADILAKNHGQADPEIVLALCRKSKAIVDVFVDEVGIPLILNTDAGRAGQSVFRLHNPAGRSGAHLIRALRDALARLPNVTLADQLPGAGLIADERGGVVGVLAGADELERIRARKVLLACDGFGANRDLLRRYIPEVAAGDYIGAQGNTGDGIRWGLELGAAVDFMSGYQGHGYVCAGYGTRLAPEVPLLGGIMVNVNGDRFAREDQGYSEFAPVVLAQPRGLAIEIFDQRIYDVVAKTEHFQSTVESGALRTAGTIEELASAFAIDPARARASLEEYNAAAAHGGGDRLGRELFGPPLRAPFYGATITGALAHTQGGLRVDLQARVQRE
ncbi:MAG: FAD-dependent oxidoreductase, partial [Chloroflexi bacterium]|nr:FAD-dependent oxidoreductase [Chloroflexota bacterium]